MASTSLGLAVEGDDRGLVEDDAPALGVDEGVGGAEVDGEVASQRYSPGSGGMGGRPLPRLNGRRGAGT